MLLPRSCLKVAHLRAQNHLIPSRGDLAHRQEWLGDRSDRGPQLKDLVSQQPGFGFKRALVCNHAAVSKSEAAVPNRLLQLRALSQELARQSRGTGARVDHKVDPSPPRVLVGDSSQASLGVGTEGREAVHWGPPSCFLSFLCLPPLLSLPLLAVLLCLLGHRNLCLGRGQLSRSSLWLGQLFLWVFFQQRAAGVPGERCSCLLVLQLLLGQGKDLLLPSSPRLVKAACPGELSAQVLLRPFLLCVQTVLLSSLAGPLLDVGQAASHLRLVPLLSAAVPNLCAPSRGRLLLIEAVNDSAQLLKLSFRVLTRRVVSCHIVEGLLQVFAPAHTRLEHLAQKHFVTP